MDSTIDGCFNIYATYSIFLDDSLYCIHASICYVAMGLTLTAQVFIDVFKQPMKVILVSVIQFLWMPLARFS